MGVRDENGLSLLHYWATLTADTGIAEIIINKNCTHTLINLQDAEGLTPALRPVVDLAVVRLLAYGGRSLTFRDLEGDTPSNNYDTDIKQSRSIQRVSVRK